MFGGKGALVARGFIERFNFPRVHNLVSLAGPVTGVYGVPDFNELCPDNVCPWLAKIMSKIAEGGYTEPVSVLGWRIHADPLLQRFCSIW
jgi:hypothetical protein